MNDKKKLNIAIGSISFPCISETFVLNHLVKTHEAGHHIDVFALRKSGEPLHRDFEKYDFVKNVNYVEEIPKTRGKRLVKALIIVLKNFLLHPIYLMRCLNFKKNGVYKSLNLLFKSEKFFSKKYDVVHCHFGTLGHEMMFLKDVMPHIKLVVTFHGFDVTQQLKENNNYYNELFKKGDLFLTVNEHFKDILTSLGCDKEKVKVHHMGINPQKIQYKEHSINHNCIKVLSVGRLTQKKGHVYALEAISELVKKYTKLEYLIVGDGPLMEEFKKKVQDLGISSNVQFLGSKDNDDILKLYDQCDVFLLPSVIADSGDKEGIPVVLMEAMASGIPVVSTFHSGIPEMIKDRESGFLANEKNPQQIVQCFEDLIKLDSDIVSITKNARIEVEENFNNELLSRKLDQHYFEVSSGK